MVQPYHYMVIAGFGALASLGLALPTGLAFGYGYGYGVRQGYHSFRPSKSNVTRDLHLSANPIRGAQGAGLLSAEEMTARQTKKPSQTIVQPPPPPQQTARQISDAMAKEPRIRATPKVPQKDRFTGYDHDPKRNFLRKEAGAVVDVIDKKKAMTMAYSAGIKDLSERNVRRLFIKKLYPFN